MAKSNWSISIKSGGNWGANSTIFRPNDNFSLRKMSTQSMIQLANGSRAFIMPDTKYNDEDLMFIWYFDSGVIKALIEGYIESGNDLRITDQDGNIYYGRFTSVEAVWQVGLDDDRYDVRATFSQIPTLE